MKKTNNLYCLQTGKTILMWSMNVFPILKSSTKISGFFLFFIFCFKYRISGYMHLEPGNPSYSDHFSPPSAFLVFVLAFQISGYFSFAFHILYLCTHWTIVNGLHMMVVFMWWVLNQAPHSLNWESIQNQILSHAPICSWTVCGGEGESHIWVLICSWKYFQQIYCLLLLFVFMLMP